MLWTLALAGAALLPILRQSEEVAERFLRAVELQRQGAWEGAAAEYRALLRLSPEYAAAHANLGVALSRAGHYDEAVAAYETAFRLDPQLTPVLLNLGIAHFQAGKFQRAADTLERFLVAHPDHSQARQLSGMALVELGHDAEAVARLEPTLEGSPDVAALYSLGLAYLRLGRPAAGLVEERLDASAGGVVLARLLRGQRHLEALEFDDAAVELESVATTSPALPRVHVLLGLAQMKLGDSEKARRCFEQELERAPDDFLTLYSLALLHEQQGDLVAARQRAEAALRQEPESVESGSLLGRVLLSQGRAAEAVRILEGVVARRPLDDQARYLLGRGYQKLGRREEAAREFAEVDRLKAQKRLRERPRPGGETH